MQGSSIDEILARLETEPDYPGGESFEAFVRSYLRHTAKNLIGGFGRGLGAFLKARYALLEKGHPDEITVVVENPQDDSSPIDDPNGIADVGAFVTRVEVHTRDRPFILTTLQEYFRRRGVKVLKSFHPIMAVHRGPDGSVRKIEAAADERPNESLVFLEVERVGEVEDCRRVRRELREGLAGVKVVTDDFGHLKQHLKDARDETHKAGFPSAPYETAEVQAFLEWLEDENFVFHGYRRYRYEAGEPAAEPAADLGVLRLEKSLQEVKGQLDEEITRHVSSRAAHPNPISILRTDVYSRVYRSQPLDYIALKRYSPEGEVTGEHVFVGSFPNRTITEKVARIPILREKMRLTLEKLSLVKGTHYYKRAVVALNTMPKEELFYSTSAELAETLESILGAEEINQVQVFSNVSDIGSRQALIVVLPKLDFNDHIKQRVYDHLKDFYQVGDLREYVCWSEEQTLRLHYYVSRPGVERSAEEVEAFVERISHDIRPWQARVDELLYRTFPGAAGERLAKKYRAIFREEYQQIYTPDIAVVDVFCLERLFTESKMQAVIMASGTTSDIQTSGTSLRVFSNHLVALNDIVPVLTNFGLETLDEDYTKVVPLGEEAAFIHTFHIRGPGGEDILDPKDQERLGGAIQAILNDQHNDHALNSLILTADLEWCQVDILLAYRNYYLQLNKDFTPGTVDASVSGHPKLARLFLEYFTHRFSPDVETYGDRATREGTHLKRIGAEIKAGMAEVQGIAADKILRNFFNLLTATLRTSYFKQMPKKVLSLKIACDEVWEMPDPRPYVETYVHGHAIEGIHLRGGPVSRGGLRWSDREDDFRTEVLGLMKTQMTKNALIVPVGAKGGFYPDLRGLKGKDRQDEAVRQYQLFIRGLLEISDSYDAEGGEVRPKDVFAWDAFDPYLVVAADKGTATFSDIANGLSAEYAFWLGDAFASGGSVGYSHKDLGITAKGAWECVKRHFREGGKDIQTEEFTCVGIGDMGGDVFGNGMLLSEKIRLVAAFNHLHIFLDPDPDATVSFGERRRLFANPKLTWADYEPKKISPGGGVFDRSAKVIPLSPQVREALGVEAEVMNGEELIQAILKAPVELLWNGGIGTYVKASGENHHEVGDKANDRVRVDATELRCKVVGEGGNLGMSQKARIEFHELGGRLNTDAIDNSGGVDLSDHEVNLKILMDLLRNKNLLPDLEARNELLKDLTWETVDLVLHNNYLQSLVISLDQRRSQRAATPYISLVEHLEREVGLDREIEEIGDDASLLQGPLAGHGIPRPKLAVMLAYAKRYAYSSLLASTLPDEPEMRRYLIEYFPPRIHERFGDAIFDHRLRREIIATMVANKIIDQPGFSYLVNECVSTGRSVAAVTRSYLLTDEFVDGPALRKALFALDNKIPAETQLDALEVIEEAIAEINRYLLSWDSFSPLTWANLADRQRTIRQMQDGLIERLPGTLGAEITERQRVFEEAGMDQKLARRIAFLPFVRHLLGLVRVSEEADLELLDVAQVFFQVGSDLRFDWLQERATQVARTNEWETQFLNRLSTELYFLQGELSKSVVRSRANGEDVEELLKRFYDSKSDQIQHVLQELERMAASGVNNLIPIDLFRDHYRSMILSG